MIYLSGYKPSVGLTVEVDGKKYIRVAAIGASGEEYTCDGCAFERSYCGEVKEASKLDCETYDGVWIEDTDQARAQYVITRMERA